MSIENILSAIDQEIASLQRVRSLLSNTAAPTATGKRRGRPPGVKAQIAAAAAPVKRKRRKMSAEGRARIVAAQKARWAKIRKAAKA